MKNYVNIHTYSFAEYTQSDLSLADFSIIEEDLLRSEELHAHDFIEMIYILSGEGQLEVNDEIYELSAGALLRLFPFHIHRLKKTKQAELSYIRLLFPLSVLLYLDVDFSKRYSSYYAMEYFPPLVQIPATTQEKVVQILRESQEEHEQKIAYSSQFIMAGLTKLTVYFERQARLLEAQQRQKDRSSIWEVLQYLHLHFNQEIDAKTVSEKFGRSIVQLNHGLYQITCKNFTDNLHEIRLRNACAMMAFPELSITYIHQYVGYQSPATFYRVFKKLKGTTPENYRKENLSFKAAPNEKVDTTWKIIMYLSDQFKEAITLESASQALYLSQDTIKETLLNNLDISFYDLLQRIRMLYAGALLKGTELEVAYIAAYVGYDSLRTFNRNFKEYLGVTPGQYRRENNNK